VAPYQVHIVALRDVDEEANQIYRELEAVGLEVLLDDRNETPGVKFNDADLIGIPIRITVGQRSLKEGKVEVKLRKAADQATIELDALSEKVLEMIQQLESEIAELVTEVPFKVD
jgi:prolyl-tRNA synthetase